MWAKIKFWGLFVFAVTAAVLAPVAAGLWVRSGDAPAGMDVNARVDAIYKSADETVRMIDGHKEQTRERAVIVRERIRESVDSLDADSVVLSVDEFIQRWRSYSGHDPEGAAGVGGD